MLPSVAVDIDEVEKSPWDEIFEKPIDLTDVPGLEQRLWQIDLQVDICKKNQMDDTFGISIFLQLFMGY